jgi:hypothetical protein
MMVRAAYTTLFFLAIAAWAGAQAPPRSSLPAAEQLRLHRANRVLLADLIDRGIELGVTDSTVGRVEACQRTARVLGVALSRAANANDADRVVELGNHLELMVRDGLVPMFDEAKVHITRESPEYARLKAAQESATSNLDEARTAIADAAKLGDNIRVHEVAGKLGGLREKLK